ncbi:MAG: site-specific DNA-methyltransferase [Chloroherpetonaceae bacterium]
MEEVKNRDIIRNDLKYPEDFINKIICGDCFELIKLIQDNSIDVILTDPPYGLNKNGIQNDNDLSIFYKMISECYRVLKDNSFFITFFSTKFLPQLFINNPFNYFWQIILYCPESRVKSPIGCTKFMSCFIFKKGDPKITHWNTDIFVDTPGRMIEPNEGYINHPTPKPKYFIKEILKMFTMENNLVLDPFIGSGSTAIACIQLNRNFIGFEIEEKYCRISSERIKKALGLTIKESSNNNF